MLDLDHELVQYNDQMQFSLGPIHEFVCISFRSGNLNCVPVCRRLNPDRNARKRPHPNIGVFAHP